MKKLLPVIHCKSLDQSLRNVDRALECGADGVFLINHKLPYQSLSLIAKNVIDNFPHFPIGLNYLDLDPIQVLAEISGTVSAIWTDTPGIIEDESIEQEFAQTFLEYRVARSLQTKYYGSIAFKYQPAVRDLKLISRLAAKYVDVVTTSGDATGIAPELAKIHIMKEAIGDKSLALASGIDVENVKNYLPYVDDFLVATSISYDFFNLNPDRVKELADKIHSY